jgi:hypothetical protein
MNLIANRQLTGEYGTVNPGQEFEARDEIAEDLLRRGLVRRAEPPRIEYETKVIVPEAPEVSPRQPFRHQPVPNKEPKKLASQGDPVFSTTNLPAMRADDFGGRRGRSRSDAKA